MNQYKMVVLSNPMPGREQECDDWYQHKHLQDIVALPGFVAGQRFHLAHPIEEPNPYRFMAVYDIDSNDLLQTLGGLLVAADNGSLEVSESLDSANAYAAIYTASGDKVTELNTAAIKMSGKG